ncbi:uncharacterized protein LOC126687802 [Mercurialis annua]|uniref:uncharacterized protein LOC126687802 n=1 Tax=Mercurialis annua TaxID=3986 RepID=UPI002160B2D2|nr:uncharacterized protein LOC126687802 [Mercurialis annua]
MRRVAWRIGNGEFVSSIRDNWIISSNFMKPTGFSNVQEGCKVSFYLTSHGDWDIEKLQHCFSPADVSNVIKISISRNLLPDKLFWSLNRNDFYSVKWGYYQAFKVISRNSASSSSTSTGDGLRKRIWRVSVHHFLWRILHESLPCNANLARWVPDFSNLYPRCCEVAESQMHALKDCEIVRGLWLVSPLNIRVDIVSNAIR